MSIVKVIEVISEGDTIDNAVKSALKEAVQTLEHIKQINVEHIEAIVENNAITKFRTHCKVSFIVSH